MDIESAKLEFKKRLEGLGKTPGALRAQDGINAMLAFYRETRAKNCDLNADGDMLLFQWGTGDENQEGEARFTVNITRQLIPTEADGEIWQLGLTFEFEPDFEDAGEGNDWCHNPSELADFEADLNDSEVMAAVRELEPQAVKLTYENVE